MSALAEQVLALLSRCPWTLEELADELSAGVPSVRREIDALSDIGAVRSVRGARIHRHGPRVKQWSA